MQANGGSCGVQEPAANCHLHASDEGFDRPVCGGNESPCAARELLRQQLGLISGIRCGVGLKRADVQT